jgi:UDP-GlcNAc:undecaprenyl-phosphate GlcNAc-1-phosphate transferase
MKTYFLLFLLSVVFSYLLTPTVRSLGQRLLGRRRLNEADLEVPRMGGLAIVMATLAAWSCVLLLPMGLASVLRENLPALVQILVAGGLVLLLGLYDDIWGASPRQKLAVEILAAVLAYEAGFRIVGFSHFHPHGFDAWYVSLPLTVAWIVGITNAFNLIDGLDGLAAGLGFFVALSVFFVSLLAPNPVGCAVSIGLAGALVGFLRYNFNPASIYLGDSGSLFLGFVFANLAIYTSQKTSTLIAVAVPLLVFGLPLLDTAVAIVRRALSGRPIFERDTDHIHHRLLKKGFSVRMAVLMLYGLGAMFSLGSLLIFSTGGGAAALTTLLVGVASWSIIQQLDYAELAEFNVYVGRAFRTQRRVLANQILIRKGSGELKAAANFDDLWARLTVVIERLDFDAISCRLERQHAFEPALERNWRGEDQLGAANGHSHHWCVRLPLHANGKVIGSLELTRSLLKGRMLFQFSSLIDALFPAFEARLNQLLGPAEQPGDSLLLAHRPQPSGGPEPGAKT